MTMLRYLPRWMRVVGILVVCERCGTPISGHVFDAGRTQDLSIPPHTCDQDPDDPPPTDPDDIPL